jgi:hypothetical protein
MRTRVSILTVYGETYVRRGYNLTQVGIKMGDLIGSHDTTTGKKASNYYLVDVILLRISVCFS